MPLPQDPHQALPAPSHPRSGPVGNDQSCRTQRPSPGPSLTSAAHDMLIPSLLPQALTLPPPLWGPSLLPPAPPSPSSLGIWPVTSCTALPGIWAPSNLSLPSPKLLPSPCAPTSLPTAVANLLAQLRATTRPATAATTLRFAASPPQTRVRPCHPRNYSHPAASALFRRQARSLLAQTPLPPEHLPPGPTCCPSPRAAPTSSQRARPRWAVTSTLGCPHLF